MLRGVLAQGNTLGNYATHQLITKRSPEHWDSQTHVLINPPKCYVWASHWCSELQLPD